MIVSFIEGRVRLRHPILTDEKVLQQITLALQGYTGINQVTANVRTGSLLVEYDPAIISQDDLLAASQLFESQFLCPVTTKNESHDQSCIMDEEEALVVQKLQDLLAQLKKSLKNDSGALFILLISSVASGFLGIKKWHAAIGSSFAILALRHFSNRYSRTKPKNTDLDGLE